MSEKLSVALAKLRESADNPRKAFGDMAEFTATIDRQGMLQPIIAREAEDGQLEIVMGHRRYRAAKKLGWKTVEVIVRKYTPQEALEAMITENSQREDVSPLEVARSYQKLVDDFGLTKDQAAERLSVGRTMFYTMVSLLRAAEPIQKALEQGKINTETARNLAAVQGGERLQVAALNEALKLAKKGEQPSSRAVIRMIQEKYSANAKRGITKHQRAARELGDDVALRRRVLPRLLTRVGEVIERRPHFNDMDMRLMAQAQAESAGAGDPREVFQRHGIRPDRLSKVNGSELRKLLAELAYAPFVALDEKGEYSAGAKAIARAYDLSLSELEKGVEATTNAEALFAKG